MGVNTDPQQPTAPNSPQQQQQLQQIQQLRQGSMTPYAGTAQGGASAQAIAQIVQALLAKQKMAQYQKQWTVQQPQPAAMMDSQQMNPMGPQNA